MGCHINYLIALSYIVAIVAFGGCTTIQKKAQPSPWDIGEGWGLGCQIDKFTDKKSCNLVKWGVPSYVYARVCVMLNEYGLWLSFGAHGGPGRIGAVRIDKNEQELFTEAIITGGQARKILKQMLSGKKGIVSVVVSDGRTEEFEFSLEGFSEAYERLKVAYYGNTQPPLPPEETPETPVRPDTTLVAPGLI